MTTEHAKTELNITRVIDATRELVFRAWTEPAHLAGWWGPKDFTNPKCELDLKPGGSISIDMKGPDGTIYPMTGTFLEISAPGKLVFTSSALDEQGNPVLEDHTTVIFTEQDGKTLLNIETRVTKVTGVGEVYLKGMEEGWNQSLDRLEAYTATIQ